MNTKQIQIEVFKAEEGEEFSSTEELNPDCYVVVYAVDDEQSFGEFFSFLEMASMVSMFSSRVSFFLA